MNLLGALFIITSILGGGGADSTLDPQREAKISRAKADIKTWEVNLIRYKTRHMNLPTQAQGLAAMVVKPATKPVPGDGWRQLAKPAALKDSWGRPYQYRNPGKHNPGSYDVYSLGPDGIEGTADDVGNW